VLIYHCRLKGVLKLNTHQPALPKKLAVVDLLKASANVVDNAMWLRFPAFHCPLPVLAVLALAEVVVFLWALLGVVYGLIDHRSPLHNLTPAGYFLLDLLKPLLKVMISFRCSSKGLRSGSFWLLQVILQLHA